MTGQPPAAEPAGSAPQGRLADLAAVAGAEWSLFWPGMGMALDSWAGVSVGLARKAAGSARGSLTGRKAESAEGSEGSEAPQVALADSLWAAGLPLRVASASG